MNYAHPVDICLIGSHVTDVSYAHGIFTSGGIGNIQRNLNSDNIAYLPLQFAEYNIDDDHLEYISAADSKALAVMPHSKWTHIAYYDWLKLDAEDLVFIRDRSEIVSADISESCKLSKEYVDILDILFHEEGETVANYPPWTFRHSLTYWSFMSPYTEYKHKTTPVDLAFTLGAGDTLVASVLNNCDDIIVEIPAKFPQIERELNLRLLARQDWWQERVSVE